jgi:hypothetical protein
MANEKRASSDVADSLHALVFQTLIDEINSYKVKKFDADGKELPRERIPPALLAQAIKALKDNGIDSPVRAKQLFDALQGQLPDLEDVEQEHTGSVQ